MSETQPTKKEEEKQMNIKVSVDDEAYKKLIEEQKKLELELEKLKQEKAKTEEEKAKLAEEKARIEAEMKKVAEEKADYEEKLRLIAEKEFERKRSAIIERAKALNLGDERIKQIESAIQTPEDLKSTEYMLQILEQSIKEGEERYKKMVEEERKKLEEEKKKLPAPAGVTPLTPAQISSQVTITSDDIKKKSYESYEAMIRDLRKRELSSDPEVAAEAKAILDELFRKWANAVKKGYEGKLPQGIAYEPEKQPSLREITRPKKAVQAQEQMRGE